MNVAAEFFEPQSKGHKRFSLGRQAKSPRAPNDERGAKLILQPLNPRSDIGLHRVEHSRSLRHVALPGYRKKNRKIQQEVSIHSICFSDTAYLDNSFFTIRDSV
jgi:hypothetical protein